MTRTRVLVVILTHTDGRNYILKFLVTLIFEDYTHKRISALTKLAECQLTLSILFSQLYNIFCIHVYFWCLQYTTYFTKYKLTLLNNREQARYVCRHLLVAQLLQTELTHRKMPNKCHYIFCKNREPDPERRFHRLPKDESM